MSKLLSARDLLELVRQGNVEEPGEAEVIPTGGTLGRKVYKGTARRPRPPPPRKPPVLPAQGQPSPAVAAGPNAVATQARRGPRNTQLIEPLRPPSGTSAEPDPRRAAQGAQNWSARPMEISANQPVPMDARGRRTTVQMRQAPSLDEDGGREDARTLELELPKTGLAGVQLPLNKPAPPPPPGFSRNPSERPAAPAAKSEAPPATAPMPRPPTQRGTNIIAPLPTAGRPLSAPPPAPGTRAPANRPPAVTQRIAGGPAATTTPSPTVAKQNDPQVGRSSPPPKPETRGLGTTQPLTVTQEPDEPTAPVAGSPQAAPGVTQPPRARTPQRPGGATTLPLPAAPTSPTSPGPLSPTSRQPVSSPASPRVSAPTARADSPTAPPRRSLSPAQPLRKVSMGVWGRAADGEIAPTDKPPPLVAKAPVSGAPASPTIKPKAEPAAAPQKPVAPVPPQPPRGAGKDQRDEPLALGLTPPASEPAPNTPQELEPVPRSSVASMFSWVATRNDWPPSSSPADTQESPVGHDPLNMIGGMDRMPSSQPGFEVTTEMRIPPGLADRKPNRLALDSDVGDEAGDPVALDSDETLVLIHYDHRLPISALAERTGLTPRDLTRVVRSLRTRGVLEGGEISSPITEPAATPIAPTAPSPRAAWEEADLRRIEERQDLRPDKPQPATSAKDPRREADATPRDEAPAQAAPATTKRSVPPPSRPGYDAAALRDPRADLDLDSHPTILELELPMPSSPTSVLAQSVNELARRRTEEYTFPQSEGIPDTETTIVDNGSIDLPSFTGSSDLSTYGRNVAAPARVPTFPAADRDDDDPDLPSLPDDADLPTFADDSADLPDTLGATDLPANLRSVDPAWRTKKGPGPKHDTDENTAASPRPGKVEEEDDEATPTSADDSPQSSTPTDGEDEPKEHTTANVLAHFENVLSLLSTDERAEMATTTASNLDLLALAYDKEPSVIRALWQNVNITHDHARFAAFHHRTALGLDLIAARSEFLKDQATQRRILRNPMVSEALLRKILLPKRLIDIYKLTLERDASERTRASSRSFLRNKFATTDPEDRLELIWKTEGRALAALSGLSIDSKTAALLCSRQVVSIMLIQNFTRFAATPPSVIAHFLKQPLVKRQVHLRNSLLKHPNCPSDAKRAF